MKENILKTLKQVYFRFLLCLSGCFYDFYILNNFFCGKVRKLSTDQNYWGHADDLSMIQPDLKGRVFVPPSQTGVGSGGRWRRSSSQVSSLLRWVLLLCENPWGSIPVLVKNKQILLWSAGFIFTLVALASIIQQIFLQASVRCRITWDDTWSSGK